MHMVILISHTKYANILGISIYICTHYIEPLGDFNALCVYIHVQGHLMYFVIKPKYNFFNS